MAIACYPSFYCLVYGNNGESDGICLYDNFLKARNNFENHKTRIYNTSSDFCLTGKNKFEIEEVEVYQVIFR